ncbi:MAG: hypothetical protein LBV73_14025 [Paraburkholderia sp.]|nr:hypothetical protein [Paraburkholderia sp.]
MKLSKYLLLMAFPLSAASYAQTSQTFHFGEGQAGLGESQSAPHAQAKPKTTAKAKSSSKHKPRHHRHTTYRAPLQDPYSRP